MSALGCWNSTKCCGRKRTESSKHSGFHASGFPDEHLEIRVGRLHGGVVAQHELSGLRNRGMKEPNGIGGRSVENGCRSCDHKVRG